MSKHKRINIIGAGLAGSLLSILFAKRGYKVHVYERAADMRLDEVDAGRSINLALAHRGIRALQKAEVFERIKPMMVPMAGRQLHNEDGSQQFQAYGNKRHEVIYSLSRSGLNKELMNAAEETGLVTFYFSHACMGVDTKRNKILISNSANETIELDAEHVFACDGAGSKIRRDLVAQDILSNRDELLDHAYKELTIPADDHGEYQMIREALHIWPRGQYMLIALPNDDGSFTLTLFMPKHGENGFNELTSEEKISNFFKAHFPDTLELIPNLLQEFKENPEGILGTVYTNPLHWQDKLLLVGDSSHAIVPFHGQGMNSSFEDCLVLDELLEKHTENWTQVFQQFSIQRKRDVDAIAEMALENYITMRDSVRHADFHLRKDVAWELETRFPEYFIPRYSMVMFHHIPYALVFRRGNIQADIVAELSENIKEAYECDFVKAESLIKERLEKVDSKHLAS